MKVSADSKPKRDAKKKKISSNSKKDSNISLKKSSPIRKKKLKDIPKSNLKVVAPQVEKIEKEAEEPKESLVKINKKSQLGLHKKKKVRTLDKFNKNSVSKSSEAADESSAGTENDKEGDSKKVKVKKLKRVKSEQSTDDSVQKGKKLKVNVERSKKEEGTEEGKNVLRAGMKRKHAQKKEKENITKKSESKNDNIIKQKKNESKDDVDSREKKRTRKHRKKAKDSTENDGQAPNAYLKDLKRKQISQCLTAIFHLTNEQLKDKKGLFSEESKPVFMQVTCIRIPKTPKRNVRILLPHSMISSDDSAALIVCDLEKSKKKNHEAAVEHYEELLRQSGCDRKITIIPLNQIRTEFDQYELKKRLANSYDYFLVDGRIAGHVSHLLGKHLDRKRKAPIPIRMDFKDLNHEIEYALRKTCMPIHSMGDSFIAQIGTTAMDKKHIRANIYSMCEYLAKKFPGGWTNIRSLRIKSPLTMSIPIYASLRDKNTVKVPVVEPKRPKAYRDVEGELTTLPGHTKVTVTPEGNVTVEQEPDEEDDSSSSIGEKSEDETDVE